MKFFAIMKATPENRVAKYADFETEVEADAHVVEFLGEYPDAFVVLEPAEQFSHWLVNMAAKTIVIVPLPPTPLEPEGLERQALRALAVKIDTGTRGAEALVNALLGPAP